MLEAIASEKENVPRASVSVAPTLRSTLHASTETPSIGEPPALVTTPSSWATADPAMKHWAATASAIPLRPATFIRNVVSNGTPLQPNSSPGATGSFAQLPMPLIADLGLGVQKCLGPHGGSRPSGPPHSSIAARPLDSRRSSNRFRRATGPDRNLTLRLPYPDQKIGSSSAEP